MILTNVSRKLYIQIRITNEKSIKICFMSIKTLDASKKSEALIVAMIEKMQGINKSRKKFLIRIFILFMGLRGRHNFLNMARYGSYNEQTYRNNFQKCFDFKSFNNELIKNSCSQHLINAFDPSYIPKSGKQTEHLGWFWSGCSGRALKGLEIGGFAVVDVENNTAMSLEAVQTPSVQELRSKGMSLTDHYASLVIERKDVLQSLSPYLTVDGYFAKKEFVNPVMNKTGLHLICKLRSDANLSYIYHGKPSGQRGRPKTLDGKINMTQIDKRRIKLCHEDDTVKVYEGIVYSKTLKRKIKLAYIERREDGKSTGQYAVLFSTDLELEGQSIYQYYKCRYQIEFLFRDAKQFTGLTQCQARSEEKMHFHFNTSLTTVSIAKAAYFLPMGKQENLSFSMSDVKTLHLNKIMADRIFSNLELDLSCKKIRKIYRDALWLGKIAC